MFYKETEYALRALVYVQFQNSAGRKPGFAEVAREIEAPQYYTAKILQRLVKGGLVMSQKGKGGGFYFDSSKAELKLKEVILFTEGDKLFTGCGFGLKNCDCNNPCPLHEQYSIVRTTINTLVTTETIQSLAKKYYVNSI